MNTNFLGKLTCGFAILNTIISFCMGNITAGLGWLVATLYIIKDINNGN